MSDPIPFFQNWTFWQWTVSLTALAFATGPVIRRWITGPRLNIGPYERISLIHTIGNPNINYFITLRNSGGKAVRIKSLELRFRSERGEFTVPAKTYYPLPTENKAVILPPFHLKPDEDWAHQVYFYSTLSREDENRYRTLVSTLRDNIQAKKVQAANPNDVFEADPAALTPVLAFFESHFKWHPGEYSMDLIVLTDPSKHSRSKRLRFTLFESDSRELRGYSDDYKYGLGVYFFNQERQPGIGVPVVGEG